MKRKVTRKNFKSWLESLSAHEVIGISRTPTSCPLAAFVKTHGYPYASVGVFIMWGQDSYNLADYYKIPIWADKFITKVDSLGENQPVTAEKCLEILRSI